MKPQSSAIILLNDKDNVAVARHRLNAGQRIGPDEVQCRDAIPAGHKVALVAISTHDPIIKYGHSIGIASHDIMPGDHVHTHNMAMIDADRDHHIGKDARSFEPLPPDDRAVFQGYIRDDGQIGTRNYIGILPTVSCSAGMARLIASAVTAESLSRYPQVDGIVALGHGSGCCLPPGSEGMQYLQRALGGYIRNPNFAAVLLVGLGCEVNLTDCLLDNMNIAEGPRLKTLNIQVSGGSQRTLQLGIDAIEAMLPSANRAIRQTVSAEHIKLGLECGGSDGYSGISANPALGAAVDRLIHHGGTAILSETPEIYGAEHLLTRRAETNTTGEKLLKHIEWWRNYTKRMDAEINNNPSPGNKAGGITTILEKSLGAVAKSGTKNLVEAYGYAETVAAKGLVFMDTPGYDVVSVTGMIAGGANMICFTTGRGSVCGFKPVPTLKLASNSALFQHMTADMDINCGTVIDGTATIAEMGDLIFERILEIASGQRTKSEVMDFGDSEFVPWHIGVVM